MVACVRLDEQRDIKTTRANWASTHLTYEGLTSYLGTTSSTGKASDEITPEQSRKAAIGMMNAFMGR